MPALMSSTLSFSLPVVFSDYAAGFANYLKDKYGVNDDINAVVLAGPANIAKKRYWLVLFKAGERALEVRVVVGKLTDNGLLIKRVMPAKIELVYRLFGAAAAETVYQFMSWRRNQNHNDWS